MVQICNKTLCNVATRYLPPLISARSLNTSHTILSLRPTKTKFAWLAHVNLNMTLTLRMLARTHASHTVCVYDLSLSPRNEPYPTHPFVPVSPFSSLITSFRAKVFLSLPNLLSPSALSRRIRVHSLIATFALLAHGSH